jgi:hypothetical protein
MHKPSISFTLFDFFLVPLSLTTKFAQWMQCFVLLQQRKGFQTHVSISILCALMMVSIEWSVGNLWSFQMAAWNTIFFWSRLTSMVEKAYHNTLKVFFVFFVGRPHCLWCPKSRWNLLLCTFITQKIGKNGQKVRTLWSFEVREVVFIKNSWSNNS